MVERRATLPTLLAVGMLLGIVLLLSVALGLFNQGGRNVGEPAPSDTTTSSASQTLGEPAPSDTTTASATKTLGEPVVPNGLVNAGEMRLDQLPPSVIPERPVLREPYFRCASGSDLGCTQLLRLLTQRCRLGDLDSCDALFAISPVGSDYQHYGSTCGGRSSADFGGACKNL